MEFFERSPNVVASSLIGKGLRRGDLQATILGAEGYARSQNSKPAYRRVLELSAGHVVCGTAQGHVLLLLVTKGGGCVLIRSIQIGDEVHEGPGNVSRALGLENKLEGAVGWTDRGNTLNIRI